jgi:hypothetical protein
VVEYLRVFHHVGFFSWRRGAVATARAALDANARKARKTYRFSKDRQVHETMTYLTLDGYNFCHCVRTLRLKDEDGRWRDRTPALAAGLTDYIWTWREWFTRSAVQLA